MALDPAIAAKIAKAKASGGGNRFTDGGYRLEIAKFIAEKKFKGFCVIVEMLVRASKPTTYNVPGTTFREDNGKEASPPLMPGATASLVCNIDTTLAAAGNVKAFILALLGVQEGTISDEELIPAIQRLAENDQPAKGMLIDSETYRKRINGGPNAGKWFIGHNWSHVDQKDEEVAARRAAQNATPENTPLAPAAA